MNASIDQRACIGCELCAKACPEIFQMENGKAVVIVNRVPETAESSCRQTADDCPAQAILLGKARGLMLSVNSSQRPSWIAL